MTKPLDAPFSGRLVARLLLLCLLAYGLPFNGAESWNATSRIALTFALVEEGSPFIDRYAPLTGDKARAGGHFASDKAPGMSFLALPAVYVGLKLVRWFAPEAQLLEPGASEGEPPQRTATFRVLLWLANLSTSVSIAALAVCALLDLACRLGASRQGALFAAFLFGFGTPLWGWATAFYGHAACGGLLVLALWVIVRTSTVPAPAASARLAGALLTGLLIGTAVIVELPAVPAAAIVAAFGLWRLRLWPAGAVGAAAAAAGLGAAGPLLALGTYNAAAFGSAFSLGYGSVVGFEGMREGLFGVGLPRIEIVWELLAGGRRGLLWLSPFLLLLPLALRAGWRRGAGDVMLVCLGVGLAFLLINAGYRYWSGGESTGPRHLTAAMGFLAFPFAFLWPARAEWLRHTLLALAAVSVFANFAASANMMTDGREGVTLLREVVPTFLERGSRQIVLDQLGVSNWISFGLYCAVLALLAWQLISVARKERPSGGSGPRDSRTYL